MSPGAPPLAARSDECEALRGWSPKVWGPRSEHPRTPVTANKHKETKEAGDRRQCPAGSIEGGEGVGVTPKSPENPRRHVPDWRITLPLADAAPRCGARTRAGTPCKAPAMPAGRCRMHGGLSTGPRTAEGLERIRAARTTHGRRTAEMERTRAMVRILMAGAKRLVERR